jgi:hypothetical protein
MRCIAVSLFVIGLGLQGCGSPPEDSAPSDPSSNVADDLTSNMVNEIEPDDAQSNISTEGNNTSPGTDLPPCGPPTLQPCLGQVGPSPTLSNPPPPADTTPRSR